MGQFYLSLAVINPLLNPGSEQYLGYYIEDKIHISFTETLGTESVIYIEDFKIVTD